MGRTPVINGGVSGGQVTIGPVIGSRTYDGNAVDIHTEAGLAGLPHWYNLPYSSGPRETTPAGTPVITVQNGTENATTFTAYNGDIVIGGNGFPIDTGTTSATVWSLLPNSSATVTGLRNTADITKIRLSQNDSLDLSSNLIFDGTLFGFPAGNTIDVTGIPVASGVFSASDVLTVSGGSGTAVALRLDPTADYSAESFLLAPDGTGGTNVISEDDRKNIAFTGISETLLVINASNLTGAISNFVVGDTIDLVGISATSATLGTDNVLNIQESSGGSVTLQLDPSQSLDGNGFGVTPDGNGGSNIILASAPLVTTVPLTKTVTAGSPVAINGIRVADAGTGKVITVILSDSSGLLAATATEGATVTGSGTGKLILSGSLPAINDELATLTYTGAVFSSSATSDKIDVAASDGSSGDDHKINVIVEPPSSAASGNIFWAYGLSGEWSSRNSGYWSTGHLSSAGQWIPGTPPGATSDVVFDASGTYGITGLSSSYHVHSLALDAPGATLSFLNNTIIIDGTLTVSAGTINLDESRIFNATIIASGGTINWDAPFVSTLNNVTYEGTLDLATNPRGSQLYVAGGFRVTGPGGVGPGTITMTNAGATGAEVSRLGFLGTQSFDNATINIGNTDPRGIGDPATLIFADTSGGSGNVVLTLGPNLIINQTGYYASFSTLSNYSFYTYAGDSIVNYGSINAEYSGGEFEFKGGYGPLTFTNNGSVNIGNSEGFVMMLPVLGDATFTISNAGTLYLGAGSGAEQTIVFGDKSHDFSGYDRTGSSDHANRLILNQGTSFLGKITGLSVGDAVSFNQQVTSAVYDSAAQNLTVTSNDGVSLTLRIVGTYQPSDFVVRNGEVELTATEATPPTITALTPNPIEKMQTTVIGIVTPSAVGDTLTLNETAGAGILNLGTMQADGTRQVIYTAPAAVPMSIMDIVGYTVTENGAIATGNASVQLDAGPSITAVTPTAVGKGQTTEIGTVTPGLAGDTLTLKQTGGSGTVALQLVSGVEEVIYTAPASVPADTTDAVTYTVTDQHNDAVATGNASIALTVNGTINTVSLNVGSLTPNSTNNEFLLEFALDGAGRETPYAGFLNNGTNLVTGPKGNSYLQSDNPNFTFDFSFSVASPEVISQNSKFSTFVGSPTSSILLQQGGSVVATGISTGNGLFDPYVFPTVTLQANTQYDLIITTLGVPSSLDVGFVGTQGWGQVVLDVSAPITPPPVITGSTPGTVEKGQSTVIGTVKPNVGGDALSLKETSGVGALALGAKQADGTQQVIYTAPASVPTSTTDAVTYTVSENGVAATGNASVQLDAGPSITAVTPTAVGKGQTTEIGTVTPGLAGDTLTLKQTGGSGTVALQLVSGVEEVIYTAPASVPANTTDAVTYTVSDQHNDAVATGNASVQLKATGASITAVTPTTVEKGQTTEIGTVTPSTAGDTLTLKQTGGIGAVALQLVSGVEEVIYTAPASVPASTTDAVTYTVTENGVATNGSASVQLDAGPSITAVTPTAVEKGQTTVIGTVTPGLTGDTLTLAQAAGSLGTLSLGPAQANGVRQVIYTAPATVNASVVDNVVR